MRKNNPFTVLMQVGVFDPDAGSRSEPDNNQPNAWLEAKNI